MRNIRRYLVGLTVLAAVGIVGAQSSQGAEAAPVAMCAGKMSC